MKKNENRENAHHEEDDQQIERLLATVVTLNIICCIQFLCIHQVFTIILIRESSNNDDAKNSPVRKKRKESLVRAMATVYRSYETVLNRQRVDFCVNGDDHDDQDNHEEDGQKDEDCFGDRCDDEGDSWYNDENRVGLVDGRRIDDEDRPSNDDDEKEVQNINKIFRRWIEKM